MAGIFKFSSNPAMLPQKDKDTAMIVEVGVSPVNVNASNFAAQAGVSKVNIAASHLPDTGPNEMTRKQFIMLATGLGSAISANFILNRIYHFHYDVTGFIEQWFPQEASDPQKISLPEFTRELRMLSQELRQPSHELVDEQLKKRFVLLSRKNIQSVLDSFIETGGHIEEEDLGRPLFSEFVGRRWIVPTGPDSGRLIVDIETIRQNLQNRYTQKEWSRVLLRYLLPHRIKAVKRSLPWLLSK